MKTRVLVFILFVLTLVSLGGLLVIIFNNAPDTSNVLTLFYLSVFFLIFGVVFFIGYAINRFRYQAMPPWQQTSAVFRYGTLLGVFTVVNLLISVYIGYSTPLLIVLIFLVLLGEVIWRKRANIKLP